MVHNTKLHTYIQVRSYTDIHTMSIISVIRTNGEVTTDVHMYTSGICISFLPLPAYGTDTEVSERKKPHKRSAWLPLTSFLSEISMRRRKHRTESEWNCAGVEGNLKMALFFFLPPPHHLSPRMTSNESVLREVCVFVCVCVCFCHI